MRSLFVFLIVILVSCGGGYERELSVYKEKCELLKSRVEELEVGMSDMKKYYEREYDDIVVKSGVLEKESKRLLLEGGVCIDRLREASVSKRSCDRELIAIKSEMNRLRSVCSENIE